MQSNTDQNIIIWCKTVSEFNKLKDTRPTYKDQLYFYTLATKKFENEIKKTNLYESMRKNKIRGIMFNKRSVTFIHCELQNTAERNERRSKMKRHPCSWLKDVILLRWQYFPSWSTDSMQFLSKSHLAIYRNVNAYPKIHRKMPESQNSYNTLKLEDSHVLISKLTIKLQSSNRVVRTSGKMYSSTEEFKVQK